MAHYNTFREQLAIAHPAFGHALWEPDPGQYPPVQVGDVGFTRDGKFHRLFNVLLPANDPSHQSRGTPDGHEPLPLRLQDHIDRGILSPNTFYSYGVNVVSGGLEVLATGVGSANVSFSCTRKQGAVLSLPVTARREDTLLLGHFRKWITGNIDSWFTFARDLGTGIEMEDIVLVTGCHRTRSWTNTAFNEIQTNAKLSLGVEVGASGASVNWRVSNLRIQGAVLGHGPNGENLPENQCIFIRGFRVKRIFFRTISLIKAAAEPKPDTRGDDSDRESENEVVSISSAGEYQDPLHVLLEYIAERAPHNCDLALVHDDDLDRILRAGDRTSLENLQPDAMIDYLERSKPEIEVLSGEHPQVSLCSDFHGKSARTKEPLSADDQSPRTNTVAILSEQLKSLDYPAPAPVSLLSHFPIPSDQSRNVSAITESETSIDDIVKTVERFRILVIGRSGVGKSSLINCVFGINDASVAHYKPGESDIQQEFESPENPYFVLHDSQGFEPGDLSNFEIVRTFIMQRSLEHLALKDRIHGLWLCVETPTAGGRVFEKGDEHLLKFAHEIQIPVVLVFTQYDRLVRSKKAELQEEHRNLDEIFLREQSEKDARDAFNKCLQSLQRTLDRMEIPMPHCARVSVRKGYQESISALVEGTRDVVKERLRGDAWIMWSIAQRASPSVKMEACVTKGMISYNRTVPGGIPGSGRLLLSDCLEKVHRDIVTCWNFKGEVLNSKEFAYLMLRLVQDAVQTEPGAYHSNVDMVSHFVALVTSAFPPTQPLESVLGFTPSFWQQLSTADLENTSWSQQFLMIYIAELISLSRMLFDTTLTPTWDGVRGAYGAYEESGSRQNLRDRLLTTSRGGHVLTKGDMDGVFRGLFAV
ncbi:hypothetical protein EDB87DRAFT_1732214 [Lactarius vividus]|nr:hypothetical protein EDB87DRAFT_1732214 [Lactarius vividus]